MAEIRFQNLSREEFDRYAEEDIRTYSRNAPKLRDLSPERSLEAARKEFFTKVLPRGFETPGHLFWSIWRDREEIGHLHLGEHPHAGSKTLFAWNFEISEPFRGKGYARDVMQAAMARLKQMGYARVSLNVFGHNKVAIHLYEAMGFKPMAIQMEREL